MWHWWIGGLHSSRSTYETHETHTITLALFLISLFLYVPPNPPLLFVFFFGGVWRIYAKTSGILIQTNSVCAFFVLFAFGGLCFACMYVFFCLVLQEEGR
ncbi:hypothetical protein F4809DRAFT_268017 [Biscogniauxia mediterranea]|nr:hypothetical protein F4809DRAFT_268017 [Biscogniauxia mediterranea]